jgi:predicted nucleic acid-binding protein
MIVLDASVVVELLTNGALAESIRSDLAGRDESFIVPHLIDVEVVSAIRRLVAGQRIGADRSDQFLAELTALPAERYSHTPLICRIRELRHNFTGRPLLTAAATRSFYNNPNGWGLDVSTIAADARGSLCP